MKKLLEHHPGRSEGTFFRPLNFPLGLTAQQLLNNVYPEPEWVVLGLIPEGLTLLASKPKMGKSYLCLGIAVGVASGGRVLGQIDVPARGVFYLALEDTLRVVQSRLRMIRQGNPKPIPLDIYSSWPRLDDGGLEIFIDKIGEKPETGLIIIDTLARIRSLKRPGSIYEADYNEMAKLKKVADEQRISIIVIHHTRKAGGADFLDRVLGSTGLTAAPDNIALLMRKPSQPEATLFVSGREMEEQELAFKFEAEWGSWVILGHAEDCRLTQERQEIIDLLRQEGCIMRLGDIASALGKKKPNVINLLNSLMELGLVEKAGYGKYKARGETSESGESPLAPSDEKEASRADDPVAGASLSETGESSESAQIH